MGHGRSTPSGDTIFRIQFPLREKEPLLTEAELRLWSQFGGITNLQLQNISRNQIKSTFMRTL